MENDIDIFRKVEDSELQSVLTALRKDWPKHFLLYQYVTIMCEYKQSNVKIPQQNLYMYGTFEDGFYITEVNFSTSETPMYWYFIYSPADDVSSLPSVLARTRRIPWRDREHNTRVQFTMRRLTPAVKEATTAIGVKEVLWEDNYLFWVPPVQPFDYGELPGDVYLGYLEETDAPKINQTWDYKSPGSENFLAAQIRNNFGLGLYRKSDKKRLAQAICFHSGGIFVLGTEPEERKKGYAEIVVRNMVKELRQRGRIPFCTVQCENVPSQSLFRKIGFQEFCIVDYFIF